MSEKVNVSESGKAPRPVNTRRLQTLELNHFMATEHSAIFDGVGFTNIEFGSQFTFNQAVELFNNREDKADGPYLLDRVKLRYSKKDKAILCTNHWVKTVESFKEMCAEDGVDSFQTLYQTMKTFRLR